MTLSVRVTSTELGYNFALYPDWKLANGLRHYRDVWSRHGVNSQ